MLQIFFNIILKVIYKVLKIKKKILKIYLNLTYIISINLS